MREGGDRCFIVGTMRWLTILTLFGVSVAQAQEASSEALATAQNETQKEVEIAVEGETTTGEATQTESATAVVEDLSPAEVDAPTSADLPTAPSDEDALTAEDIIPMAPMPEFALPDEALVDPAAVFMDELPAAPPPAVELDSASEKLRSANIRYREVRVQAAKDPVVVAMFDRAQQERTLEGKRAALREYYRLLFAKVTKIDKSLEDHAKEMEVAYIRRLAQIRLEPTIPLQPPPTPEPLN